MELRLSNTVRRIHTEFLPGAKAWRVLNYLLLLTFTVNTVFLPYDTFGLKKGSLILLLIINAREIFFCENRKAILIFGLVLTSINIAVSILSTLNIVGEVMAGYMGYILLLYPVIEKHKIDYERMLEYTLLALAVVMVGIMVLDLSKIYPIAQNSLVQWMNETENATLFGIGAASISGYGLFFKTAPMFAMGIAIAAERRNFFGFLIMAAAMLISGTRADFLVGLCVALFCIVKRKNAASTSITALLVFSVAVFIVIDGRFIERVNYVFTSKNHNDLIRSGLITATMDGWKYDPLSFFTGSGFTSKIYDRIRDQYMDITEVSYWNLLRQVGLVPFIATMIAFLYPAGQLFVRKEHLYVIVGLIGYLLIAYTNPLLYSSTGFAILLYMYYLWYREEQETVKT
ncbi:MAG: hypothetical protein K6G81_09920 [Lachnospiraceae bacterium]|nr:hypothetical protein [Lachnospiraceae bacterium]